MLILLGDEWRNVALEEADADTEEDEADNIWCERCLAQSNDLR